jgi:hypothetical protein
MTVAYSEPWRQALEELFGDMSNEQVSTQTGISSEYIRKMRKLGQVPSREIIGSIAEGFKDLRGMVGLRIKQPGPECSPAPAVGKERKVPDIMRRISAKLNNLCQHASKPAIAPLVFHVR